MKKWRNNKRKEINIIEAFNDAINGIIESIKKEKHMRFHIISAVIVILLCIFLDITKRDTMLVVIASTLVIITEMINTAFEHLVDMITQEYNKKAKLIKDISAGAVMVAAINALIIGYLVFYDKLLNMIISNDNFIKLTGRLGNVTVLIITLVAILVITIKAMYKKGTSLEGGMPSGHSALSFSLFAIIIFTTNDLRIIILSLIMALLVAQSRIKSGIHTFIEVLAGAILGFGISYLILYLLVNFGQLYN